MSIAMAHLLSLEVAELKAKLSELMNIVDEQADDVGLWFIDSTAPERYLQQALRRLHAAIEGEM